MHTHRVPYEFWYSIKAEHSWTYKHIRALLQFTTCPVVYYYYFLRYKYIIVAKFQKLLTQLDETLPQLLGNRELLHSPLHFFLFAELMQLMWTNQQVHSKAFVIFTNNNNHQNYNNINNNNNNNVKIMVNTNRIQLLLGK